MRDIEIWTVNHAFVLGEEKIPRIDRVFEIHKKSWFLRKELSSATEYWEWLKQAPCPVVMQDVDPEIPSSVRYPREQIDRYIFGKLLRGDEINVYYTSSFSYMLAMAIYEQVDRVEIYGIEMASDTEYGYQKPGGEFMIGAAIGRGVEVVLHPLSELCKARVYGYDGVPNIPRTRTEELLNFYHTELDRAVAYKDTLVQRYNSGEQVYDDVMEASSWAHAYEGAVQIIDRLMGESDYYLGRQNLERQATTYRAHMELHKAIVNEKRATYAATGDAKVWQEYLDARATMYANMGAEQVIRKLMDECDLKVIKPELILTIQEK